LTDRRIAVLYIGLSPLTSKLRSGGLKWHQFSSAHFYSYDFYTSKDLDHKDLIIIITKKKTLQRNLNESRQVSHRELRRFL